ncbi:ATP-binding cassette domain-containing protein [Lentibacillus sp. Marseille-P4043]|uniref:ATP-binding cassette domain-containing protein n=1 Tax=Lentibacillus sp. Marseille-P4043 TaxID=2040293 RepID=UPI0022790469|nr:ATP-binding cassette domain-containing protein [Lentibacillus sp. Marseille-P4043]
MDIIFENVNFEKKGKTILNNVTFCIKSGEFIGIAGKNGSGKSSLLNLLSRLEYLNSGKIKIQNIDLSDINYVSLYKNVKYVCQENEFIQGTILDNIFGEPNDDIDVTYIEWLFNKFDMPFSRKDLYNYQVSENGNNLSGGQKQRLAIIRALVFNPPILLLDEITSSLDKETEKKVLSTIDELRKGKITLFISHRMDNLKNVDKLIKLDNGKVSEILLNDKIIYVE